MKDTIGRENRKLQDKTCLVCGKQYRPAREAAKYCSRKCATSQNGGHNRKAQSWWKNPRGYIEGKIWIGETQIRVRQHRFIMEGIIGRPLLPDEDVHHIDGNRSNNDPQNLEIIKHDLHTKKHSVGRKYPKGYKMKISDKERQARRDRAIAKGLWRFGQAAQAQARAALALAVKGGK